MDAPRWNESGDTVNMLAVLGLGSIGSQVRRLMMAQDATAGADASSAT